MLTALYCPRLDLDGGSQKMEWPDADRTTC